MEEPGNQAAKGTPRRIQPARGVRLSYPAECELAASFTTKCRPPFTLGGVLCGHNDSVSVPVGTLPRMVEPFVGSEALAAGTLTRYTLRSGFVAVYPDVYLARGIESTAIAGAKAAWLWSKRRGVVAGRSAAAMLGAKWVDPWAAAELVHDNRHPPHGVDTWWDHLDDDELVTIGSMRLTTPVRTALDIACRRPLGRAVAEIDALARATHLKPAAVELLAERYRGRRGIRSARTALDLVDAGAESPRKSWLRLLLVRGIPSTTDTDSRPRRVRHADSGSRYGLA